MDFDGYEFVHEEISLRNPPPLCIGIPMLKEYADGCIKLYDIRKTEKSLHICAELNISLIHIHIVKENLGCFDIPL
uniref:DUF4773 domain-containing protein n=1 Tax=Rhabditophanes sp. KR3021 TaxID=114890 RepID=A0AC35TGP2_9BILA